MNKFFMCKLANEPVYPDGQSAVVDQLIQEERAKRAARAEQIANADRELQAGLDVINKLTDAKKTQIAWGLGGTLGGAGLGAAAGYFIDRRNRLRGLLIGGVLGGLTGAITGGAIGNSKANEQVLGATNSLLLS